MSDLAERIAAQQSRQKLRSPTTDAKVSEEPGRRNKRWTAKGQRWARWLHVYSSMIAFVVILFFGVTGLLLNHPSWLFGDEVTTTVFEGTLPDTVVVDDGRVEFLAVSEFLRSEHGVGGEVTNFDEIGGEGSINYTGPGYGATARFDVISLEYEVTLREEGFVNAMRDLHTGSDTGSAWDLLIDIAAVFLVFVALTGLGIQLLMRKRRRSAVGWLILGTVICLFLIWLTLV